MEIEIWTDGSTGGFNIAVDGATRYYRTYEDAHCELVRLGLLPFQAAWRLSNAMLRGRTN